VTNFGLTRIVGELRKLGIKKISRQTVRNILKEEGILPSRKQKDHVTFHAAQQEFRPPACLTIEK